MASTNTAYIVSSLIEKMSSNDSDFRFMAASDLATELRKDTFTLDDMMERKSVSSILKLLVDRNGEVQNMAVKCLVPLVRRCKDIQVWTIVDEVCRLLVNPDDHRDELRDIAGIALKTLVVGLSETETNRDTVMIVMGSTEPVGIVLSKRITPKLIEMITEMGDGLGGSVLLDMVDVFVEVLARFGTSVMTMNDVMQDKAANALVPLLAHTRPAVRKRAVMAISLLAPLVKQDRFDVLMDKITNDATEAGHKNTPVSRASPPTALIAALARSTSSRLSPHLYRVVPHIIGFVDRDDDDLRELALNAIESCIMHCGDAMKPYIDDVIDLCCRYVKHDPNYDDGGDNDDDDGDEGDDGDGDMELDEEEDEDDLDGDYTDDEDVSWKVRRATARLISAIIVSRNDVMDTVYTKIVPVLVKRFGEREDVVRVDVITTLATVIARSSGTESGVPLQLVSKIVRAAVKQLNGRSLASRSATFVLLRNLVLALKRPPGLGDALPAVVRATELSIASRGLGSGHTDLSVTSTATSATGSAGASSATSTSLKIEALDFLGLVLSTHVPEVFQPIADRIVPAVLVATQDKFYKVSAKAFGIATILVRTLRPVSSVMDVLDVSPTIVGLFSDVFRVTIERIQAQDASVEVRERAITTLAVLMSHASDVLPGTVIQDEAVPVIMDRLNNEFTRLQVIRLLAYIAESPLTGIVMNGPLKPLVNRLPDMIPDIAIQLRKSQRQLRVTSLHALAVLIRRFPVPGLYTHILDLVCEMVTADTDLQSLPLAISLMNAILESNPAQDAVDVIKTKIVPVMINVVCTSPHIVAGGTALKSLMEFWNVLVNVGGVDTYMLCVDGLLTRVQSTDVSREAYLVVAKSIAALSSTGVPQASTLLSQLMDNIRNTNGSVKDAMRYLSLLILGEIGNRRDLSIAIPTLYTDLFELFGCGQEDIKNAAAFALGNIATGNFGLYMPILVDAVRGSEYPYLSLMALKESIEFVVVSDTKSRSIASAGLTPFVSMIWQVLFEKAETKMEDGVRNVLAECLGLLSRLDAETFLPKLRDVLGAPNPETRATVLSAIRYTFGDHAQSVSYDALLAPLIVEFLQLVHDEDLNVRRVTLGALNAAAHSKPHLIRNSLSELLPLLYAETYVKEELIHIVEMGPFKHKVDKGLDARKSAFECMYTLLDTCLTNIDMHAFIQRVIAGITDPAHDIKLLSHLMVQRLTVVMPTSIVTQLDNMVDSLRETLVSKTKNNAVKQEVEKHQELVHAGLKSLLMLIRVVSGSESSSIMLGTVNVSNAPKFNDLYREMRSPQSPVIELIPEVEREVIASLSSVTTVSARGMLQSNVSASNVFGGMVGIPIDPMLH